VNEPRLQDAEPSRAAPTTGATRRIGPEGTGWERAVGYGVVALCICVVIGIMNPEMRFWPLNQVRFGDLFANTTTNGGDMGAHVWWPWYLKEHWFGQFRLSGGSPDW